MLDGLFMLLSLSTLMAIASFLAGSLPLSFSLSQSRLRVISTLGMGVLVGTSLIVIIPEGVETLYSAAGGSTPSHAHRHLISSSLDVRWHNTQSPRMHTLHPRHPDDTTDAINALPGPVLPPGPDTGSHITTEPPKTPTAPGEIHILDETSNPSPLTPPPENKHTRTPHAWIGISLISGFILMYLIDTIPSLKPPTPPSRTLNVYSLSDLSSASSLAPTSSLPPRTLSTTLGLVIHAAADGIALGASSTQPSLSFIIFVAIMVHKAPAAFGLTSVLLKQGLGKRAARAHLLVFSFAAPIGALATWVVVRILGGGDYGLAGEKTMKWWTGVLLLFSGGTFLYVAMHTMQEDDSASSNSSSHEESLGNGYLDGSLGREPARHHSGKSLKLVLAAVAGMLLPLLTQIGHAH